MFILGFIFFTVLTYMATVAIVYIVVNKLWNLTDCALFSLFWPISVPLALLFKTLELFFNSLDHICDETDRRK